MNLLLDLIPQLASFIGLDILPVLQAVPADPAAFDPFNMELWDTEDFLKLVLRFTINTIFVVTLVRYVYYPVARRKDFLFTYILISLAVFLLCFMLENVKLELGFALGLFAIFGIIRYRTDPIPIKEMTYLFIVIGLSVMNALVNKSLLKNLTLFLFMLIDLSPLSYSNNLLGILVHFLDL